MSTSVGRKSLPTVLAVLLALMLAIGPANLAMADRLSTSPGGEIGVSITSVDGSAPFNATDGPGLDSGDLNDIVRTNDSIVYRIGVIVGPTEAPGATITLNLPAGVQMATMPATCQAGSSLTPAAVTTYAWNTNPTALAPQVLTCIVNGPLIAGSTTVFEFSTRVLPGFTNGAALKATAATAITLAGNTYESGLADVTDTVSAAAKFDVQVMGTKGNPDTAGYVQWEGRYNGCIQAGPTGGPTYSGVCVNMRMPVQIAVPDGARGSTPIDPTVPFNFKFDMSLDNMFGAGATQYIMTATKKDAAYVAKYYGARLAQCALTNPYDVPTTTGGGRNGVVNSGTTTCTYSGAAAATNAAANGQVLDISVTGMDSTAFSVPTLNGSTNNPILPQISPTQALFGYVYSTAMVISVPAETLGLMSEWSGSVKNASGYLGVATTARDLTIGNGTPNIGDVTTDDTSRRYMLYDNRNTVQNFFTANIGDYQRNPDYATVPSVFGLGNGAWYGPAGPSTVSAGNGVLFRDQVTYATIYSDSTTMPGDQTLTSLYCTAIDTTEASLSDPTGWVDNGAQQQGVSPTEAGVGPVWPMGALWNFLGVDTGTKLREIMPVFEVKYGIGGVVGSTSLSDCAAVQWYDSAQAAEDAAGVGTAGDGVYQGVTHVQVLARTTSMSTTGAYTSANITYSIGIPIKFTNTTNPNDVYVGTWTGGAWAAGNNPATNAPWTAADLMARAAIPTTQGQAEAKAAAGVWRTSNYDKITNTGDPGDRLHVTADLGTLTKQIVYNGTTYGPSDLWDTATQKWLPPLTAQIPRIAAGDVFSYQLTPKVIGDPTSDAVTLQIEECVPANVTVRVATWNGQVVEPVEPDEATSELTCDTTNDSPFLRETHLLYQLPGTFQVGQTVAPLLIEARIAPTSPSVSSTQGGALLGGLVNRAVLQSPSMLTSTEQRESRTRLYVDASATYAVSKTPVRYFVEANPYGVPYGEMMPAWDLVVNNPGTRTATEFDLIDALPVQGQPAGLGQVSSYHGTYELLQPEVVRGDAGTLLYTTSPSVSLHPDDASNQAAGSTVWCAAPTTAGGAWTVYSGAGTVADCPTARTDAISGQTLYAGVTGVRSVNGQIPAGDHVQVLISLVPTGNAASDRYVNQASGILDRIRLSDVRQVSVVITDPKPHLAVTKQVSGASGPNGAATLGDTLTYTVHLRNVGAADFTAANPYVLVDDLTEVLDYGRLVGDLPAGTSLVTADGTTQLVSSGALASGAETDITYQVEVVIDEASLPADSAVNVAFESLLVDGNVPTAPVTPPTTCEPYVCATVTTPLAAVGVDKAVTAGSGPDGSAMPGDVLTYTLTLTNLTGTTYTAQNPAVVVDKLAGVLDNGTLGDVTASAGQVSVTDGVLTWWGELPLDPAEKVTITYPVTIGFEGDQSATNLAFGVPGTDSDADPATPPVVTVPDVCEDGDLRCATTTTTMHNDQSLYLTKTVAGASGDNGAALAGDVLTYTVQITHNGDVAYAADRPARVVDDLSDVLDDADLDAASVVASSGTVGVVDNQLQWTGPLAPLERVTITYQVKVKTGLPGNDNAKNVAFGIGYDSDWTPGTPATPPTDCTAPACVTTGTDLAGDPVLKVAKKVAGPSSAAKPGTKLTYTVTATNTGPTSFNGTTRVATIVDDLSDVLDDATLGTVSAQSGKVVVDGNRLVWTGAVAAGASVDITYVVTVTAAGNQKAVNVAFVTADPSQQHPTPGNPDVATTSTQLTKDVRPLPITGAKLAMSIIGGLLAISLATFGAVILMRRRREEA